MVKKTHSLQEFRKMITVEYISKGIKPLTPNGEKEIQLYHQWLKGNEILEELNSNDK